MINPFFENKGPKKIEAILTQIKFQNRFEYSGINISDIKDLVNASNKDITFFHSKKYELAASKTKAAFCITTKNLSNKLPDTCKPIEVDNVLVSTAMITTIFYPDAIILGGGMSNIDRFYKNIPPLIAKYTFSNKVITKVLKNFHGDSSGVRGAAWLWNNV